MPTARSVRDQASSIRKIVESVQDRKRLVGYITQLAREVHRLEEDNQQLRAAVAIYRELAGRPATSAEAPVKRARIQPESNLPGRRAFSH